MFTPIQTTNHTTFMTKNCMLPENQAMKSAMRRGERIELRGFGVFQVKPRKKGIGRNPRTGREVRIPPGKTIRFKPGKNLRNLS